MKQKEKFDFLLQTFHQTADERNMDSTQTAHFVEHKKRYMFWGLKILRKHCNSHHLVPRFVD